MIVYLTGAINRWTEQVAHHYQIGMMITPDTNGYRTKIPAYPYWATDNACFNHPETFSLSKYLGWLKDLQQYPLCLFAPAPDVVGNAALTWERSANVLPQIRALNYPAALVAQDGIEYLSIPWDEFDVLFIGGSTEWKLSPAVEELINMAHAQGKHIHMGRVNSEKRLRLANRWGCQTADGTLLAFGPKVHLPRLCGWLDRMVQEERIQCASTWPDPSLAVRRPPRALGVSRLAPTWSPWDITSLIQCGSTSEEMRSDTGTILLK